MVFISYLYGIYMVFSTYHERRESQSTTPEKREFDDFKTARAESPTPNRAVRKGCYSIDA